MKKVFTISSSLLVAVLIFFVAYNIAFKKDSEVSKKTLKEYIGVKEERLDSLDSRIIPISDEPATGIFLDKKNEKISFYSTDNGKAWKINFTGSKKDNISNNDLIGLEDVLWSPSGHQVISVFKQIGGARRFSLYDYQKNQGVGLDGNISSIAWDNYGNKIIYGYTEKNGNKNISIADPDGKNWKKIADTQIQNLSIAPIPQTSLVSFWNEGKNKEETGLFVVGTNGGEVKKIFSGKFGADYKWSPSGERAIVSYLKDQAGNKMTTGLVDINGGYVDLGIPTIISKMEWSLDNKYVYYALPSMPENMTMPDDYKIGKFKTTDTFWKINIKNGEKTRLIGLEEINGAYDVDKLFLSPSEDALFFVNRSDGKIYRLKL